MTDREMVAETFRRTRLRRARRDRKDRLRRPRAARGRVALRQRLCLARRKVPLRAELAGRRGQEGLPLDLRSRRAAALRRLVGRQRADERRASRSGSRRARRARFLNSSFSETAGSQKRQPTPTVFIRSDDAARARHRRWRCGRPRQSPRRSRAHRESTSTACRRGADRRGRPPQQGARATARASTR